MLDCVSAGECKGRWADHSHHLKLRISFGIVFPLNKLPLRVEEQWQSCLQSSFICLPEKLMGGWAKPAKLVGEVEGEDGADQAMLSAV